MLIAIFLACATSSKNTLTNSLNGSSATPSPLNEKRLLWTLKDPEIQNPESTYYDLDTRTLYVSNVAGSPTAKDHNGWISKVDLKTGKIIKGKWAKGLNAPKGLGVYHGVLWVSDIDQVVAINQKSGKIKQRIKIKGAQFLNDIAIGDNGEVYVSDMFTATIHVIKNGKASVFVKDPENELPNGLLVSNNTLYVAGWGIGMNANFTTKEPGHLLAYDLSTKAKTLVSLKGFGNLDGLESDGNGNGNGNFFISDWIAGKVYFVNARGEQTLLLQDKPGTADIGYIQSTKTLIIPGMNESVVKAYTVN